MGTFKITMALAAHLLSADDFIAAMNGSLIKFYGSPTSQAAADALIPVTASAALGTATLLCTVSVNGTGAGITFDPVPINGAIYKTATEAWRGTNVASGYPSFYRMAAAADTGALTTTEKRVQGSLGNVGTDMVIALNYLTSGVEQRVDSYVIGMPTE